MALAQSAAITRRPRAFRVLALGLIVATMTIVATTMAGCAGGEADSAALDGTSWKLVGWSENTLDPAEFTITADFEDGRIGGTSAVNNYGGPYSTGPGDEFSIGPIASTMMAGTGGAGRAERVYFELLEAAEAFAREGGALTLYDAEGGESLVFELVEPAG